MMYNIEFDLLRLLGELILWVSVFSFYFREIPLMGLLNGINGGKNLIEDGMKI